LNHRPAVIVYDVAPPYKENWNVLQLLCEIPQVADIPMVLTAVNKTALESVVGKTDAFEIRMRDADAGDDGLVGRCSGVLEQSERRRG
jgi:hypothetical protein